MVDVFRFLKSFQTLVIGNIDFFPRRNYKNGIIPMVLGMGNKIVVICLVEKIHIGEHIGNAPVKKADGRIDVL